MGKRWDASGIAYDVTLWAECLRVLKPGGYLLAFGGTRTYHRLAVAVEDAGFEIRDSIHWLYGSGFPKSMNVGMAMDKAAGAEREVIGSAANFGASKAEDGKNAFGDYAGEWEITAPATPEAEEWDGWGTALKPAHEPVVVARKPLEGTVVQNVLKYRTGALNIDATRIATSSEEVIPEMSGKAVLGGTSDGWDSPWKSDPEAVARREARAAAAIDKANQLGRWPANIVLSHHADCEQVSEGSTEASTAPGRVPDMRGGNYNAEDRGTLERPVTAYEDVPAVWACVDGCPVALLDAQSGDRQGVVDGGGASRFFAQFQPSEEDMTSFLYVTKPSKAERNAGLAGLPDVAREDQSNWCRECPKCGNRFHDPVTRKMGCDCDAGWDWTPPPASKNHHPTVKPLDLMRWLVRLTCAPGGTILDPFSGSGTTLAAALLEGRNAVGVELTEEYLPIIEARIEWAEKESRYGPVTGPTKIRKEEPDAITLFD